MITKIQSVETVEMLISRIQENKISKLEIKFIDSDYVADYQLSEEPITDYSLDASARAMNILNEFKHAFIEKRVQKFSFTFTPLSSLVSSAYSPVIADKAVTMSLDPFEYMKMAMDCLKETDISSRFVSLYHKDSAQGKKPVMRQATFHSALVSLIEESMR